VWVGGGERKKNFVAPTRAALSHIYYTLIANFIAQKEAALKAELEKPQAGLARPPWKGAQAPVVVTLTFK
jgi:hypothetical protein